MKITQYTRQRRDKLLREQSAKDNETDAARLKRAVKDYKLQVSVPAALTPAQEIAALERYLVKLLRLQARMQSRFGGGKETISLRIEIKDTISQIVSLHIRAIKPESIR